MKPAVIVNLHAGAGAARRHWPAAARLLGARIGPVDVHFTTGPGHATALARQLAAAGHPTLIAAGGDGTLNEVVNGALGAGVRIGLLPLGSGADFARTLGLRGLQHAVEVLAAGVARPTDVVRARFRGPDGETVQRHYLNIASFGLGARAAATVAAGGWTRLLPPRLRYLAATLAPLFAAAHAPVTLHLDQSGHLDARPTLVAAANGRYQGGGILIAPDASIDDGHLDLTLVESATAAEILRAIRLLYNGRIYSHPKVHHHRVTCFRAESEFAVPLELDGEPVGSLPFSAEVLPGVLLLFRP